MQKGTRSHPAVGAFCFVMDNWECAPLRSAHHQRNNYFIFRVCRGLRTAPNAIFTGGVVAANCICSAAFCESAALRACPLPGGSCRAATEGGYKWRSEKSVKAIAPTGAALAFLCFDFFFRFVKGEQPLATGCGTQHPLRALGGTRVLLAAAPTTAPCFRRWRRSQLLHCGVGGVQR